MANQKWSREKAWEWYRRRPWVMGINYLSAITFHGVELWQADTIDEVLI